VSVGLLDWQRIAATGKPHWKPRGLALGPAGTPQYRGGGAGGYGR
jgi:hypothetical protein